MSGKPQVQVDFHERELASFQERHRSLVGARIVDVWPATLYGELWPVLEVEKDGMRFRVTVCQDPEKNGPGYLDLSAEE